MSSSSKHKSVSPAQSRGSQNQLTPAEFNKLRQKNKQTPNCSDNNFKFDYQHTKPGSQIDDTCQHNNQKLKVSDYPQTPLDQFDYSKRLQFQDFKKIKLTEMCQWKQRDVKGIRKNAYIKEIQKKNERILSVAEKEALERLEVMTDTMPFLKFRKQIHKCLILLNMVSAEIIQTSVFDNGTTLLILINSVVMMIDNPADQNKNIIFDHFENVFLVLYTMEMVFKILGMGFIFGEKAYLRDSWNILDFVIVVSSLLTLFEPTPVMNADGTMPPGGGGLSALRSFRVMRPLRTISSVKGLKLLMGALISAIPLLVDTLIILLGFFLVFSIAGSQLLSGVLKLRCFDIQTGREIDEDNLCSVESDCEGGQFCGKSNTNPNSGATNFDNVFFSFLVVFQSVTLEGWSDVQVMIQKTYSHVGAIFYFVPIVFIGSFFLLNLTLAVINSKFTEAHHDHIEQEAKLLKDEMSGGIQEDHVEIVISRSEMSISQFITARIYAKKMIEFLRMRQEIKRIEQERMIRIKEKQMFVVQSKRNVAFLAGTKELVQPQAVTTPSPPINKNPGIIAEPSPDQLSPALQKQITIQDEIGAIQEEDENHSEESEEEQFDKEIQDFLKNGKIQMQRQGQNTQDINIPKHINENSYRDRSPFKIQTSKQQLSSGGTTMKGNIGPTKKSQFLSSESQVIQKKLFLRIAEDFDIDKIIPKEHQNIMQSPKEGLKNYNTEKSFNLSAENDDLDIARDYSEERNQIIPGASNTVGETGFLNMPTQNSARGEEDSGLITSDSDFDRAVETAGYNQSVTGGHNTQQKPNTIQLFNIKKDISKTFKKMLTSNHNYVDKKQKNINSGHTNQTNESSTKYEGSQAVGEDNQTQLSEIEQKFRKKKIAWLQQLSKQYKEDADLADNYLENKFGNTEPSGNLMKTSKEDVRQLQEFVTTKRPKDPFKNLQPLKQKVNITKGLNYNGTSQNDVLHSRIFNHERKKVLKYNIYLQLPTELQDEVDPDFIDNAPLRTNHLPYQQKVYYEALQDSSEADVISSSSTDEDILFANEQPYKTCSSIAYKEHLKQVPIQEITKRSDIMITSTLSLSLYPKDRRAIRNHHFVKLNRQQLIEYLDQKAAFQAMVKEHQYQHGKLKEKDKDYKETYMKSFIHRSNFKSNTLSKFKKQVESHNNNTKQITNKTTEQIKSEKLKHDQNKRASEKRGLPKFDMDMAKKLLDGKFHEDDEEDNQVNLNFNKNQDLNQAIRGQSLAEIERQNRFEEFENQLHKIMHKDEKVKSYADEIPVAVKNEFELPDKLGMYEINFVKIRKNDVSLKKNKQTWSGQDVLQDGLNNQKSLIVVHTINSIRVWPGGIFGWYKRCRSILRLLVLSPFYDGFMTFAVLLNTIVLALDSNELQPEETEILNYFNEWFTWIFIFELASKLLAIGINKYIADKMNWLDGGVVGLSIFEKLMMVVMQSADGQMDMKAFKTLRMLRTMRVFRITRLLKALQSMQIIIAVIAKSYMSFFYIAMLMILFIIIFALLGTQIFGGKFGNDVETLPRGNYDKISIAIITVFQVLTMENWQSVLFDSIASGVNQYFVGLYYMVWIFLGNFILLNLFLAILLDSFLDDEEEEADANEIAFAIQQKRKRKEEKLKRQNINKVFMGEHNENKIKKREALRIKNFHFGKNMHETDEDLEDLDEKQIIDIFKEENIIKKTKEEEGNKVPFEPKEGVIQCEQSFYMFSKQNTFRIFCYNACQHSLWENSVMTMICLSSGKLAFDAYLLEMKETDPLQIFSSNADKFFNYVFIIEMTVKLIAQGMVMDEGSYLRDSWSQLDFFIVMSSIVDMVLSGYDLAAVKIMRMLRVLRPLRVIAHNPEMKLIVNALIDSIGHIMNVLVVITVVYLIFAIIGVNLYGGKFFFCSIDKFKLHTAQECELNAGLWSRYDHNFDNTKWAMITLYVVSSLEGWPDIMIQTIDMTDVNIGPLKEYSVINALFYIIFIFIGSFFFLNFFIGVLFLKFNEAQKKELKGFSQKDIGWKDIQKLIIGSEPDYETTNVPKKQFRKSFHDLVSSSTFEKIIMSCIVLNILQMAVESENMTVTFSNFLDFTGNIFSIIFFIEMVLKLIAYGDTYFKNSWNRFDFVVVFSSLFDVVIKLLENIEADLAILSSLTQLARVARIMRVTRILKLAGKNPGLLAILETIQFSIPSLMNVATLLILIFFMFSVLGNFMFNMVREGDVIDTQYKNFRDFHTSFILVFALSTGEDWNKVMFDLNRTPSDNCVKGLTCGADSFLGYWYFILLVLVCSHVMLNLFILVIIQQFEHYYLPKENIINNYKNDLSKFMKVWKELTQDKYHCTKIKENQLTEFFKKLGAQFATKEDSLGFSEEFFDTGELKKNVLKMGIKSNQGFIYFNELLYRCMRRQYGNMKINKKMQIFELKTQFRIFQMTLEKQNLQGKKITTQMIEESIVSKKNGVNPFLAVMNFKISIKTWIKQARKNLKAKRRQDAIDTGQNIEALTSLNEEADISVQKIRVEIEVEELIEITSEEDDKGDSSQRSRSQRSPLKIKDGGFLVSGQNNNDLCNLVSTGKGKKRDHLKHFERKMSQRFSIQAQQIQAEILKARIQEKNDALRNSQAIENNSGKNLVLKPFVLPSQRPSDALKI